MFVLRLAKDLDARLSQLAEARGCSKSELVREAIVGLIEDQEDFDLAERALRSTKSTKPLRQLRKELGLDG